MLQDPGWTNALNDGSTRQRKAGIQTHSAHTEPHSARVGSPRTGEWTWCGMCVCFLGFSTRITH